LVAAIIFTRGWCVATSKTNALDISAGSIDHQGIILTVRTFLQWVFLIGLGAVVEVVTERVRDVELGGGFRGGSVPAELAPYLTIGQEGVLPAGGAFENGAAVLL